MSYDVENTAEEVEILKGARIREVRIVDDGFGSRALELHVTFAPDLLVNGNRRGVYQVWQDEEGNGPGYLALTQTEG